MQYQSKIEAIVVQVKLASTYSVERYQKTILLCQTQPSSVSHRFSPAVLVCGRCHCRCPCDLIRLLELLFMGLSLRLLHCRPSILVALWKVHGFAHCSDTLIC